MGTPVWSHDGGICTGEAYKAVVKLTFFEGASLDDPKKLFNLVSTETSDGPSTSVRAKKSTPRLSRRSSRMRSR